MKVLFDHCVPRPLRRHLPGHEIATASAMGWEKLENGKLLAAAELQFEVMITSGKNIRSCGRLCMGSSRGLERGALWRCSR